MKKFRLWAVVATIALFLTVFSAGSIFAVADETKETEEELMVDGLPWNADVVTETDEPLRFENITAKEVIVEGDNAGVVRINGGDIDRVTVKAAEIPEFGFKEIVELIAAGVPVGDVMEMYKENLQLKADSSSIRPTVKVVGGAEIDELVLSGGAVVDVSTGYVDKISVKPAVDSGRVIVTIKNYDGQVDVVQTPNTDGSNNILNIELKNSNLTEVNVDGDKKCVFHIGGDNKSYIEAMVVEGSSDVITMVDTTEVKVAEDVEKASVRIYSDVENLVVDADNSYLYVAASSVVTNATVNGDNTTVGFNGRVDNSEITGTGSKVVYQAPPTATPSPTPSPKPQGIVIGNEDNSTGWWTAHSETVKVAEGESKKVTFYNFTNGVENWFNFLVVLQNVADAHGTADNATYAEYAVLRTDNYGWKGALNPHANNDQLKWVLESNWNWDTFKTDINGAKVDLEVTNNGATADVVAKITTEKGKSYYQNYKNIAIDGELHFCLTVEQGHLIITNMPGEEPETPVEPEEPVVTPEPTPVIELEPIPEAFEKTGEVLGATDYSTAWWTTWTGTTKIDVGTAARVYFQNHGGAANWNNFAVILQNAADGAAEITEYAVTRADNYGWLYAQNTGAHLAALGWTLESNWNWDTFATEMKDATVVLDIVNYGKTADILATITTATGEARYQNFRGIAVNGDLYYRLTVDGAYIEFLEPATEAPSEPETPSEPEDPKEPEAHEHVWVKKEIPATCTESGKTWEECECEAVQKETVLEALGHGELVYKVVVEATVEKEGKYEESCPVCKEVVKTGTIDKLEAPETSDPNVIGAKDFSTAFRAVHSENFKVEAGTSKTVVFKNYNKEGAANWNNFSVVLHNDGGDAYKEYAVLRADNYGWNDAGNTGANLKNLGWVLVSNWNWTIYRDILNGATVELTVTNFGSTATVVANVTAANGATYYQKFGNIAVDGDLYYCLSVDSCYLVMEEVKDATQIPSTTPGTTGERIGEADCSTAFFGKSSELVKVEAGKTATVTFRNYTLGEANYQNFCVSLKNGDGAEQAFVRADNWGWLNGDNTKAIADANKACNWNWDIFKTDINGALVELEITNNGTTADVVANVTSIDGVKYYQKFTGLAIAGDLYYQLTVDHACLVLE